MIGESGASDLTQKAIHLNVLRQLPDQLCEIADQQHQQHQQTNW
jgi:hypothetical protein